jgi:hypothetical protein
MARSYRLNYFRNHANFRPNPLLTAILANFRMVIRQSQERGPNVRT